MLDISPVGMRRSWQPTVSVVVPAYNEAAGLEPFHQRLVCAMACVEEAGVETTGVEAAGPEADAAKGGGAGSWEVIYVNDGSDDATQAVLEALRRADSRIALLSLSRNFGKETAITAGLDHAAGEAVVVIDADLQDPPELIPALVAEWRSGFDMVYAKRRSRDGESWLKRRTAHLFYRLMQRVGDLKLPRDTGDFRLMSRRAVDAVRQLREQHRFMKGLFAWVGYPTTFVLYDRSPRHAGVSKWNYWKLWNLAMEGITSFSLMPLKLATYVGVAVALLSVVYGVQVVVKTLVIGNQVAGYPSIMTVMLFLGGIQLVFLGVIGEYLGRVFNETKQRPLYLVERYAPSSAKVAAEVAI